MILTVLFWFAAGVVFQQPHPKPCLGPPVAVRPSAPVCVPSKDMIVQRPCSLIVKWQDGTVFVLSIDIDVEPFAHTDLPALTDEDECLCRMDAAYPGIVWWETGNPCGLGVS